MKPFKYNSPIPYQGSINVDGKQQDLILHDGDTKELPEAHPVIASMVLSGLLVEQKPVFKPTEKN